VSLHIAAACCTTKNVVEVNSYFTELVMNYRDEHLPAVEVPLDISTSPGNITIVVAALRYTVMKKTKLIKTTETRWMPAAVIGAMYN
jgi:hypothetical protein